MTKERICKILRKCLEEYALSYNFPADLAELCAIASFSLKEILEEYGYSAEVYLGKFDGKEAYSHCWVRSDGLNLDLTATQFKNITQKVVISDHTDKRFQFGSPISILNVSDWPDYQQPTKETFAVLRRLFYQKTKYNNTTISLSK